MLRVECREDSSISLNDFWRKIFPFPSIRTREIRFLSPLSIPMILTELVLLQSSALVRTLNSLGDISFPDLGVLLNVNGIWKKNLSSVYLRSFRVS